MTLKAQVAQLTATVQEQNKIILKHEQDLTEIKRLLRDMQYDVTQARKWSKGYR